MMKHVLSLALSAVVVACSTPTEPITSTTGIAIGRWGGPQVDVTVSNESFEFTAAVCVRGHFPAPAVQENGTFSAEGTLEPMAGPPPPPPWPHGRISGKVRGNVLLFSATYDNGTVIGPLTATFGATGPISPCPV